MKHSRWTTFFVAVVVVTLRSIGAFDSQKELTLTPEHGLLYQTRLTLDDEALQVNVVHNYATSQVSRRSRTQPLGEEPTGDFKRYSQPIVAEIPGFGTITFPRGMPMLLMTAASHELYTHRRTP